MMSMDAAVNKLASARMNERAKLFHCHVFPPPYWGLSSQQCER